MRLLPKLADDVARALSRADSARNAFVIVDDSEVVADGDGILRTDLFTELAGNASLTAGPVSYTHLDVYKRQGQKPCLCPALSGHQLAPELQRLSG